MSFFTRYHTPKADPIKRTFDDVSAVIRLAHKYHIQKVQNQALAYVQEHYYTNDFNVFSSPPPESEWSLPVAALPSHAIGTVNLARLTDTPSILPLALYQCTCLGTALLDGWTRPDGTVERLSDADLRRCLNARVALASERFFLLSRVFGDTPSAGCRSLKLCGEQLRDVHRATMRSRVLIRAEDKMDGGVLRNWVPLTRSFADEPMSMCGSCVEMMVERAVSGRKRLWNRLPEILGIDVQGWGEPDVEPDSEDEGDDNDWE